MSVPDPEGLIQRISRRELPDEDWEYLLGLVALQADEPELSPKTRARYMRIGLTSILVQVAKRSAKEGITAAMTQFKVKERTVATARRWVEREAARSPGLTAYLQGLPAVGAALRVRFAATAADD